MDLAMLEKILLGLIIVLSIVIIFSVLMQPTKNTGFTGETGEQDKIEKRSVEKFFYRLTIIGIVLLFFLLIIVNSITVPA